MWLKLESIMQIPVNAQDYLAVISFATLGIVVILWLSIVIWAFRDIRSRSRSTVAAILTLLVVAIMPIVGLVIYLLLRPRLTLEAAYDRALEQEALLQQIEEKPVCPTCSRPTQTNWYLCPSCHTHLRHPCPTCRSPLEMHWDICPYCGHLFDVEGGVGEILDQPPAADQPLGTQFIEDEPTSAELR